MKSLRVSVSIAETILLPVTPVYHSITHSKHPLYVSTQNQNLK